MKAALAGLDGVDTVEHEAGTDVFVIKHHGKLNNAAKAVDRVVLLRWIRRAFEKLGRLVRQYYDVHN